MQVIETEYITKLERLYALKIQQLDRARNNPFMLQVISAEADAIQQEIKEFCTE